MKPSTFVDENERAWQPISPSNLKYSIDWNNRTGRVRLRLPNGAKLFSEKNTPSAVAEITGEKMLMITGYGYLLKRREFNAPIPIIKLG